MLFIVVIALGFDIASFQVYTETKETSPDDRNK